MRGLGFFVHSGLVRRVRGEVLKIAGSGVEVEKQEVVLGSSGVM